MMCTRDFSTIRSPDLSCSIKYQFNEQNQSIYYNFDIPSDSDHTKLPIFCQFLRNLTQEQKKFFLTPKDGNEINENSQSFIFCPGSFISSFYFPNDSKSTDSYYEKFKPKDKFYITIWVFSLACAIQIILKNKLDPNKIFDRSVFIDSEMNARFSYSNWESERDKLTTVPVSEYFLPPEYFENSLPKDQESDKPQYSKSTLEQKYVYSLGVFMLSLLNRVLPNIYLHNCSRNEIVKNLSNGEMFKSKIPDCPWKTLVGKCLNRNPIERPSLDEVINDLLKKENCLNDVGYSDFRRWLWQRFNVDGKNTDETFKSMIKVLSQNPKQDSKSAQTFKVSDFEKFIKLAKDTSFEEIIQANCEKILDILQNQILRGCLKTDYSKYRTKENQYVLMETFLKHNLDSNINTKEILKDLLREQNYTNLFYLENMCDNLSFFLRVANDDSIRFVLPRKNQLLNEHFKEFNGKQLFVFSPSNTKDIIFYPFLNVYNILYHKSSKNNFEDKQKIKWLYQTAKALQAIHEKGYTIKNFNSQNVFIDMNSDAHFLPSYIYKIDDVPQIKVHFYDEFDYINSFYSPELISDRNHCSVSEKSNVFSFGIFIQEIIYNIRPGALLGNFSIQEKCEILSKGRILPYNENQNNNKLFLLMQSCLSFDPRFRKTFKEIANELQIIWNENYGPINNTLNENLYANIDIQKDFFLEDAQKAYDNGAVIFDKIKNYIYQLFDENQKFGYDYYMAHNVQYSKFDIIMSIYKDPNFLISLPQTQEKMPIKTTNSKDTNPESEIQSCSPAAIHYIKRIDLIMKKVHDRPNLTFCHFGGLSRNFSKQLGIRTFYNLDREYRQKIDFSVKNQFNLPYGTDMKMKGVNSILEELKNKFAFGIDFTITQSKNGNDITQFPPITDS